MEVSKIAFSIVLMNKKGEENLQQTAGITENTRSEANIRTSGLKEKLRYIKSNYWLYLLVLPDVEEDTVITSLATLVSDNGPTRQENGIS